MPKGTSRSWLRSLGLLAVVVGGLAVLRPWTVRPLNSGAAPAFDAASYASRMWPRIVDESSRTAVDVTAARSSAGPHDNSGLPARRSIFVRATGTVTAIDRRSRVGLARLRVGDALDVAVQIGPVVRGTALRDATSFIRFNDFANQFEFAAVSGALHARVLQDVVTPVDLDALTGREVSVLGATTIQAGAPADAVLEIVPIHLSTLGAPR